MEFSLTDNLKLAIERAKDEMEKKANSLTVSFVEYEGFGKDIIKKLGLKPDAILQLAIQVSGGND